MARRLLFETLVSAFLLTGLMSLIVSGIAVARSIGITSLMAAPANFLGLWAQAYLTAWVVAFPVALFVVPLVRKATATIASRVFGQNHNETGLRS